MLNVNVRRLQAGDDEAVLAAHFLFDVDPKPEAVRRFLAEPTHHMLIAYDMKDQPVGFVSGIEMTQPDKGTEMFLYELGVDCRFRQQGVGRTLVDALKALANDRLCYGMWVLTDVDNVAAQRLYKSAGSSRSGLSKLFEWRFPHEPDSGAEPAE